MLRMRVLSSVRRSTALPHPYSKAPRCSSLLQTDTAHFITFLTFESTFRSRSYRAGQTSTPFTSRQTTQSPLHGLARVTRHRGFIKNPRFANSQSDNQVESIKPSRIPTSETKPYHTPTSGLLGLLPTTWVPYAELARLDKPAGSVYLFFPCLFSTFMAANYASAPPAVVVSTILLFGTGALIMRGAGCTVNDLWDRDLDPQVARTRLRPLARKAVGPQAAIAFAGAQCLAGLAVLLQFPQPACLYWGAPSLILVGLYPLAKRITHYPQFVLGLTFSWGALMGFPALGVDITSDSVAAQAAAYLYASCVSWTVLYDMIYAHMDLQDDRIAGIKSIALKHEQNTKQVLTSLAVVQIALLAASGDILGLGPAFFVGSCGGSLCTLLLMIWRVKLQDASNCWWWFRKGAWWTGGALSLGLLLDYLQSMYGREITSQ